MRSDPELLKFLELASQRVQHHHNALWEEEKHYSWWIYIIFAGLIFLYFKLSSVTILDPWQKALVMGIGNFFGFYVSLIGYNAIRRESQYFHEAVQIRDRVTIALGLHQPKLALSDNKLAMLMPPILIKDFSYVKSGANRSLCRLATNAFKAAYNSFKKRRNPNSKFGIRDGFQLTFFITALLFIGFAIFASITLLN